MDRFPYREECTGYYFDEDCIAFLRWIGRSGSMTLFCQMVDAFIDSPEGIAHLRWGVESIAVSESKCPAISKNFNDVSAAISKQRRQIVLHEVEERHRHLGLGKKTCPAGKIILG